MLKRGDLVPHFDVKTIADTPVSYRSIWQRRNLVLIALPDGDADAAGRYMGQFTAAAAAAMDAREAECVATRDPLAGITPPAVVVADRWGEVVCAATAAGITDLPGIEAILEWLEYVQHRCPECEGEAR